MSSDENDLSKRMRDLKTSEKTNINILLLGETGVGKSTFINSIANYLTYTDLKRAKKENLLTLIPSTYKVLDKEGEYHIVKIGSKEDKNEYIAIGESATQDVKSYVFPIWDGNTKVRLIDTPGIGDTRGIEQDNINYENILSYIGQLHELHAICILFKPTNARLTNLFDYCMSQILTRLDKSASRNIIFIFTNTRGTDYGPGETLPLLQRVIQTIKDKPPYVDIPLNRNIFCFDNEAFRYLAAVKQGVEFDATIKERNKESWKKSVDQCWSLIKYIVGDSKNRPLVPHFIKSTNAINEARRLIVQLSKPLAEITQLIHDNLRALERHKEHLNLDTNTLETLKKKLYMPVINLDVKKLSAPVTVCTNTECAEMYKVGDLNKWHYKQRCHNPCYLKNVQKEIIGSPELVHCAAMDPKTQYCQKCMHIFSVHMHIYYMTETKEDKIVDPNVQSNIDSKEKIVHNAKKIISDIGARKIELEKEHDTIVKCSARFAHFLQNNAITPFSDSYKEYIEHLIMQEKSHPVSDKELVAHLEKLLHEYEEAKNIFDQALAAHQKITTEPYISAQNIQDSIQDLYKLKHNGKKIKELYECQKKNRSKEHERNTEYIHKVISKQPEEKQDDTKGQKTKKEDKQKNKPVKPSFKNKTRTESQNIPENRRKGRKTSPPPAYEDVRSAPSSFQSHHSFHPPPPSPGMYPPGPYYGPPHPPAPNPYPHPSAGPHFYPGYDSRPGEPVGQRKEGNKTYQIKVVVDEGGQNTDKRGAYSDSGHFGIGTDPQRGYNAPHPQQQYSSYSQPSAAMGPASYGGYPHSHPQGYPAHYSGAPSQYHSWDPNGQYPRPNQSEQRPHGNSHNQNTRGRGGQRGYSQNAGDRGGQRRGVNRNKGDGGQRGKGRGGVNSNNKFKNYRKKKNEAETDSDDSDSS